MALTPWSEIKERTRQLIRESPLEDIVADLARAKCCKLEPGGRFTVEIRERIEIMEAEIARREKESEH